MAEEAVTIEQAQAADPPVAVMAASAGVAQPQASSRVDASGIQLKGATVGDTFSAPVSLTADAIATGTSVSGYGSGVAELHAFGLTLEDLADASTGDAVRDALTTGTGTNLSSTLKLTAESSGSSVDGVANARTFVDAAGVQADQATIDLGGTGTVAASVSIQAGADSSTAASAANAYLGVAQATGLDLNGGDGGHVRLEVGNNFIASGAVSADFLAAAESAADDATATAAIDRLLGADVEQLLVGGSSRIDGNTDVSLGLTSASQSGASSSIVDAASILGLDLHEAAGSGDLHGVRGALLLNNLSTTDVNQTSTSSSGDASATAAFDTVGGIHLGDVDTGAQLAATTNNSLSLDQTARSSGGDVEASTHVNDVYGLQQEGLLETGGSTTINATLEVDSKRAAQAVAGAASSTYIGADQVGISLGVQEAAGNVQLIVNNFLGGESVASSVLATASSQDVQAFLAGIEATSLSSGGTTTITVDNALTSKGTASSNEDTAVAATNATEIYGVTVDSASSAGDITINADTSASVELLAESLRGDAAALAHVGSEVAVAAATLLDGNADAKLVANALAVLDGTANSVDGTAVSHSDLAALLGLKAQTVAVEGDADLIAKAGLTATNSSRSLAGDASSSLSVGTVAGSSVDGFTAGGDITLGADASADVELLASSLAGIATSDAVLDHVFAVEGSYSAGGDADLHLGAVVSVGEVASSIDGNAFSSVAIGDEAAAFGHAGGNDLIHADGSLAVAASSEFTASLEAASTAGDVAVQVDGGDGHALNLAGTSHVDVSSGADLTANVSADAAVVAEASTQEGAANAAVHLDVSAVDAGNVQANRDGQVDLAAASDATVTASTEGGEATDDANAALSVNVHGFNGGSGEGIAVERNGSIESTAFNNAHVIAQSEAGQAQVESQLKAVGASLLSDGVISIGGVGDIHSVGVIGAVNAAGEISDRASMIANSQTGNVGVTGLFAASGISGGEVQGAGGTGSLYGAGIIGADLLSVTLEGDAINHSQASAVGLDHSMLGAGFGNSDITGVSRVAVDSLTSTDLGNALASHNSHSVGVFANSADPTITTAGADLVAIAEDNSFVTAMTSHGQASSSSSSETVGISGAHVTLYGEGDLVVNAHSKASALSSSNA